MGSNNITRSLYNYILMSYGRFWNEMLVKIIRSPIRRNQADLL